MLFLVFLQMRIDGAIRFNLLLKHDVPQSSSSSGWFLLANFPDKLRKQTEFHRDPSTV